MRVFRRRRLVRKGLTAAVKRASGEQHRLVVYLNNGVIPRLVTAILIVAVLTFLVSKARDLGLPHVGERAKQDIIAARPFEYPDEAKRSRLIGEARDSVPNISRLDEAKTNKNFERLIEQLAKLTPPSESASSDDAAAASTSAETQQLVGQQIHELFPSLDERWVTLLVTEPAALKQVQQLRDAAITLCRLEPPLLVYTSTSRLTPRINDPRWRSVGDLTLQLTAPYREAGVEIERLMAAVVGETVAYEYDGATTQDLKNQAEARVPTQSTRVEKYDTIIREGTQITPHHRAMLRAYFEDLEAAVTQETRWSYRGLVAIVVALLVGLAAIYLYQFEPRVFQRNSKLALLGVLSLVALGLAIGIARIEPDSEAWRDVLRYPVLVALPAMVIAMAFPLRLAFFLTVVLSVLSGVHYHAGLMRMTIEPSFVLLGLVSGAGAALYAPTIRYRKQFVRTGAMIGLLSFFVIVIFGLLTGGGSDTQVLLRQGLSGLAAGVVATTLAWILLPTFETLFHITTNVGLIELGDSNHPLLKRMVMEAPGTYHHSLVVGNLAESAAESIGANPLLSRVGALYHDIGKLKKPDYFSENEQQARSRHDTLIPSMSSLIITSHVKDGIDLAYKYRLKPALIDIIREHHGTSLVYYFYKRATAWTAAEQNNGRAGGVDEADYRYPGPKPQSKEAAIIMLADAVEAAARAMEKPTATKIRTLVRELILARFNDGQLDESELTLRDLHRIQESFTHILLGTFHQRVKYPKDEQPADEQAEEPANEPTDKEDEETPEHPEPTHATDHSDT